jgi:hypothetical protein
MARKKKGPEDSDVLQPEIDGVYDRYIITNGRRLPRRFAGDPNLPALNAAINFWRECVPIIDSRTGEMLCRWTPIQEAFTEKWRQWDLLGPIPELPEPPSAWPLVQLTAPIHVNQRTGEFRPTRCGVWLVDDVKHMRAAAVLEIEERAVDAMRQQFRLRPLPPRTPRTRKRDGTHQFWFLWPGELTIKEAPDLPPGVTLLTDACEAPADAKRVPERLANFTLPELPRWIALAAGGRLAETYADVILGETGNLVAFRIVGDAQ